MAPKPPGPVDACPKAPPETEAAAPPKGDADGVDGVDGVNEVDEVDGVDGVDVARVDGIEIIVLTI